MKKDNCTGCKPVKGSHRCVLSGIVHKFPKVKVECPCFECLVKVMCIEQCSERQDYFTNNIERLQTDTRNKYSVEVE